MKYYNTLLGLGLGLLLLVSCGNSSMENFQNKADYIAGITNLSDDARVKQLNNHAKHIEELLESVGGILFYSRFSLEFSSAKTDEDMVAADSFALPPPDSLLIEFANLNEFYALQKYALPHSNFQIKTLEYLNYMSSRDIAYDINKVYVAGEAFDLKETGLKQADSLSATASISFPASFHTLEIHRNTEDRLSYKDYTINISDKEDRSIEVRFPVSMSVISYQGVSADGVLMETNNRSDFPMYGLSPQVESEMKAMIHILRSAAQASDKEACCTLLETIDSHCFSFVNSMAKLEKDYEDCNRKDKDGSNGIMKKTNALMSTYSDILEPRYRMLSLGFPQSYSHVLLYVTDSIQTVSHHIVAHCCNGIDDEYRVFYDHDSNKAGVLDHQSVVVIPATYEFLYHIHGLYFTEIRKDDKSISYYLNADEKKFEELQEGISFFSKLNNELTVFYNEDNDKGVLKNNKIEIIPFIYNEIKINGDVLIAIGSKRGRPFYEFYTLDGQKLNIPVAKQIKTDTDYPHTLISTGNKQWGMINERGELTVPVQYEKLDFLSDKLLAYSVGSVYDKRYGLIDVTGQVLTEPIHRDIHRTTNGLLRVYMADRQYGYIDENGQIQIGE